MAKQILSEEFKRMQKLAGLVTESEYKKKLNEVSRTSKVSFGPFKNVGYYKVGSDEHELCFVVTDNDNFSKIENSIDFESRDYMTNEEISFLNGKIKDLADEMSKYLTSIGIKNEVYDNEYDNPTGYGQEINNLVVSINPNDLSKLK